jgi:hypothetical protein
VYKKVFASGTFAVGDPSGIEPGRSQVFALAAASSNPSHTAARFTLFVGREQHVAVAVFDARGRRRAVLHDGPLGPGEHPFALDGADLPSGTYFIRAVGSRESAVRRVTLLR